MLMIFTRDPIRRMVTWRDRADRLGVSFLERHAVRGTVTRDLVVRVAEAINRDPRQVVKMIPDMRRKRRYEQAIAGLRNAGLLSAPPETVEDDA